MHYKLGSLVRFSSQVGGNWHCSQPCLSIWYCSLGVFPLVLFPGLGSFLTCLYPVLRLRGTVCRSPEFSVKCSSHSSSVLQTLSVSLDSQLHLLNSQNPAGSAWVLPYCHTVWKFSPKCKLGVIARITSSLSHFLASPVLHFLILVSVTHHFIYFACLLDVSGGRVNPVSGVTRDLFFQPHQSTSLHMKL